MTKAVRLFVSGTGTGVGKTVVTTALAAALRARGEAVVALKPIETGCAPEPLDALALAAACGRPELAHLSGSYRARAPLAPFAATLAGEPALAWDALVGAVRPHLGAPHVLVEGAGGLLVPLDPTRTIAELAAALELPLLLVARDALGVLSDTLAAVECATRRGLEIAAVVLRTPPDPDSSIASNVDILAARIDPPVLRFPNLAEGADPAAAGAAVLAALR